MEADSNTALILKQERKRVRRLVDVLFDRLWSKRHVAHNSSKQSIVDRQIEELNDLRYFRDQLYILIDAGDDPDKWPRDSSG